MELEEKLYHQVLSKRNVELNAVQEKNFRFACKKSIPENPDADFNDLLLACNVYLNFILSFPSIDLGEIVLPDKN